MTKPLAPVLLLAAAHSSLGSAGCHDPGVSPQLGYAFPKTDNLDGLNKRKATDVRAHCKACPPATAGTLVARCRS